MSTMSSESVLSKPPPAEDVIPPEPEATITAEKFEKPEPEPQPTAQNERPEEESRANAFKHGCSGSGKVLTPGDKDKAEHLFKLLCEEHQPETEYQKLCLRENAYARTLADRCQEI